MKGVPVIFSGHPENGRVGPEEKRRLAFNGVAVRPASIHDLVRDDGIYGFIVDCPWMNEGRNTDDNNKQHNGGPGELELSNPAA
jgi:hypothetical protein